MHTNSGTLLGGRVRHDQPVSGHRTGLEPVLLAASIPARPGERVLEGGTGSGAGLLCLAARLPAIGGLGIERDAAMADLARRNVVENGFNGLTIVTLDLETWSPDGLFDHAFANPPWHEAAGTASPVAPREAAKRAHAGLLTAWASRLAAGLRPRGTLTLVVAASHLPACLAAITAAGCGSPAVFPFWPKVGRPARLVLVRGVRGGRGPARLLPGLVLHDPAGGFSAAAQAVLRDGAGLEL